MSPCNTVFAGLFHQGICFCKYSLKKNYSSYKIKQCKSFLGIRNRNRNKNLSNTTQKKYGVFSGPFFPVFGLK